MLLADPWAARIRTRANSTLQSRRPHPVLQASPVETWPCHLGQREAFEADHPLSMPAPQWDLGRDGAHRPLLADVVHHWELLQSQASLYWKTQAMCRTETMIGGLDLDGEARRRAQELDSPFEEQASRNHVAGEACLKGSSRQRAYPSPTCCELGVVGQSIKCQHCPWPRAGQTQGCLGQGAACPGDCFLRG